MGDLTNNCYHQLPVQQQLSPSYLPTYHQLYPRPTPVEQQEDSVALAPTALPLVNLFGGVFMEFVDTLYTSTLVQYVCERTAPSEHRMAAEVLARSNLNPNAKEFNPRSASRPSVSSVTSSVVSQLQPSIAAAVAEALKASSRPVSRPKATYKAVEEPNYGPAKYNFGYKVADEESQAYINHQESREGNDVTGTYNYVNPAGALVTVNYEAGVDGFSQTRDVEQGAVQMRNIPGAWSGPLAGVGKPTSVPATTSSISNNRARVSSSSQVSQEALIAQILSSIQPKISSAV